MRDLDSATRLRRRWHHGSGIGQPLLPIAVDGGLPQVLAAQHQLNGLAHGAPSARRPGHVMGVGPGLGTGVGHGDGQAAVAQERQVGQIVANTAYLLRLQPSRLQELLVCCELVRRALDYGLNLQLGRADLDGARSPARDDRRPLAQRAPGLEARAVAHMKELQLLAAVVVNDAAIGQHAVYVQDEHGNVGTTLGQHLFALHHGRHAFADSARPAHATWLMTSASAAGKRPITSVMSSRPTGLPDASTTGSSLMRWRWRISTASATRLPWATVSGSGVITSQMGRSRAASRRCSKSRARSLSVKMPDSRPLASNNITAPVRRPRRRPWAKTSRTVS